MRILWGPRNEEVVGKIQPGKKPGHLLLGGSYKFLQIILLRDTLKENEN